MRRERPLSHRLQRREWLRRLDRVAADLNVLLIMFAIGLASLNVTFLITRHVINRLPQTTTHVVYADTPATPAHFP
jgi:hypothetical protein